MLLFVSLDPSKIEPKIYHAKERENVIINCLTTSVYNWSFNGGSLPQNTSIEKNQLKVFRVKRFHQGHYYCSGKLGKGSFKSRSTLYVHSE